MSQYPEPPPPDRVEARYREERQLARLREVKEKQDMILQRRKYVLLHHKSYHRFMVFEDNRILGQTILDLE